MYTGTFNWAPKDGGLPGLTAEQGAGHPLLSRQVIWLEMGRGVGNGHGMAAFVLESSWQGSSVFPRLVASGF